MKKKIISLCLVVALVATAIAGATLAYFTDTDSAENVMTLGNVDIKQNEQQRNAEGKLVDFVDWKPLMPRVDTEEITANNMFKDGYFNPAMKNVVDKIISVTNEADATVNAENKAAYVRTLIAFEGRCDVQDVYIGKLWNSKDASGNAAWVRNWVPKLDAQGNAVPTTVVDANGVEVLQARELMINGVVHTVIECIYVGNEFGAGEGVLPAGKTTPPTLKQIFMSPDADNEIVEWFGNEYTIYALTQATQVAGFEAEVDGEGNVVRTAAEVALDTAFGDPMTVSDQVIYDWFKVVK